MELLCSFQQVTSKGAGLNPNAKVWQEGPQGSGEAAPPSNGAEHSWHEPAAVVGTQTEGEMSQHCVLLWAVVCGGRVGVEGGIQGSAMMVMVVEGPSDDCNALRGKQDAKRVGMGSRCLFCHCCTLV